MPAVTTRAIKLGHRLGGFGVLAGGDFQDAFEAMLLVAGIDALRRIAQLEIAALLQAGDAGQDRAAIFLGDAGIDGGFIDHQRALAHHLAHAFGRRAQRLQIGAAVLVDRASARRR